MNKLLHVCALVCSCLGAGVVTAQNISSDIDPVVQAYYERECSAELNVMLNAWNSQGMNGPLTGAFYMEFSRMDAAAVQQRASVYLEGPGQISRRWETELDWVTNAWENCLVNAREKQLALPLTRFTLPTRPLPPANFRTVTGADGGEEYVMGDGSKCIRVLPSQRTSATQAGYFEQWATVRNKCNRELEVRVCKPDDTCMQIMAPPDSNIPHLLGTTQGLAPEWDVRGSSSQQGGGDPPQQVTDPPRIPAQPPAGGGTVTGPDNTPIDFGDDSSAWAHDGECDDPRFSGPGSAAELVEADYFHDATDCRQLLAAGRIEWTGYSQGPRDNTGGNSEEGGGGISLDGVVRTVEAVESITQSIISIGCATNPDSFFGLCEDADDYDDYDETVYDEEGTVDEGYDDGEDDSDDCPYNSDGDPETVCTVQ